MYKLIKTLILEQILIKTLIEKSFASKQLILRNKKQKRIIKLLKLSLELKSVNCTTLLIFFLNVLTMRTLQ